jgi:hypothetical protein
MLDRFSLPFLQDGNRQAAAARQSTPAPVVARAPRRTRPSLNSKIRIFYLTCGADLSRLAISAGRPKVRGRGRPPKYIDNLEQRQGLNSTSINS